jgi:hypothetical protein
MVDVTADRAALWTTLRAAADALRDVDERTAQAKRSSAADGGRRSMRAPFNRLNTCRSQEACAVARQRCSTGSTLRRAGGGMPLPRREVLNRLNGARSNDLEHLSIVNRFSTWQTRRRETPTAPESVEPVE